MEKQKTEIVNDSGESLETLLKKHSVTMVKDLHKWQKEAYGLYLSALGPLGEGSFSSDSKEAISFAKKALKYHKAESSIPYNPKEIQAIYAGGDTEEVILIGSLADFNFKPGLPAEVKVDVLFTMLSTVFATLMLGYKYGDDKKNFDKVARSLVKFANDLIEDSGILHYLVEGDLAPDDVEAYRKYLTSWVVAIPSKLGIKLADTLYSYKPKAYPLYLLPSFKNGLPCFMVYLSSSERLTKVEMKGKGKR